MSQARLQKRARLLKAAEFKYVFDQPLRSRDRFFTVLARGNGKPFPRLGLAISKKHARRAVARNRIKRIVRESFRQSRDLCNVDVVVMTTPNGDKASNQQLFASLQQHWQNINQQCAAS